MGERNEPACAQGLPQGGQQHAVLHHPARKRDALPRPPCSATLSASASARVR
jgi:hypothetical protein